MLNLPGMQDTSDINTDCGESALDSQTTDMRRKDLRFQLKGNFMSGIAQKLLKLKNKEPEKVELKEIKEQSPLYVQNVIKNFKLAIDPLYIPKNTLNIIYNAFKENETLQSKGLELKNVAEMISKRIRLSQRKTLMINLFKMKANDIEFMNKDSWVYGVDKDTVKELFDQNLVDITVSKQDLEYTESLITGKNCFSRGSLLNVVTKHMRVNSPTQTTKTKALIFDFDIPKENNDGEKSLLSESEEENEAPEHEEKFFDIKNSKKFSNLNRQRSYKSIQANENQHYLNYKSFKSRSHFAPKKQEDRLQVMDDKSNSRVSEKEITKDASQKELVKKIEQKYFNNIERSMSPVWSTSVNEANLNKKTSSLVTDHMRKLKERFSIQFTQGQLGNLSRYCSTMNLDTTNNHTKTQTSDKLDVKNEIKIGKKLIPIEHNLSSKITKKNKLIKFFKNDNKKQQIDENNKSPVFKDGSIIMFNTEEKNGKKVIPKACLPDNKYLQKKTMQTSNSQSQLNLSPLKIMRHKSNLRLEKISHQFTETNDETHVKFLDDIQSVAQDNTPKKCSNKRNSNLDITISPEKYHRSVKHNSSPECSHDFNPCSSYPLLPRPRANLTQSTNNLFMPQVSRIKSYAQTNRIYDMKSQANLKGKIESKYTNNSKLDYFVQSNYSRHKLSKGSFFKKLNKGGNNTTLINDKSELISEINNTQNNEAVESFTQKSYDKISKSLRIKVLPEEKRLITKLNKTHTAKNIFDQINSKTYKNTIKTIVLNKDSRGNTSFKNASMYKSHDSLEIKFDNSRCNIQNESPRKNQTEKINLKMKAPRLYKLLAKV